MHWLITAALATPLELPPDQDPALWAEPAALAGLELGPATDAASIRVVDLGAQWTLVVVDPTGSERQVTIDEPRTPGQRVDAALLASSLLVPVPPPAPVPPPEDPPPVAPKPEPEPEPTPEPVAAPLPDPEPTPAPAPAPPPPVHVSVGLALASDVRAGPRIAVTRQWPVGPVNLVVEGALTPWTQSGAGWASHGVSLTPWLRWSAAHRLHPWADLGVGATLRAYHLDGQWGALPVPVASARVGVSPGRVGGYVRADCDLRATELQTPAGPAQPSRCSVEPGVRVAFP